jgi:hypothetical protein
MAISQNGDITRGKYVGIFREDLEFAMDWYWGHVDRYIAHYAYVYCMGVQNRMQEPSHIATRAYPAHCEIVGYGVLLQGVERRAAANRSEILLLREGL